MRFRRFSPKQRKALGWWCDGSPERELDGILCDGAVRSGKTLCLGLGFFFWAMARFEGAQFALCGATLAGVERNVLSQVLPALETLGFRVERKLTKHQLTVGFGGRENVFYLYGGRTEGSATLIQGITLAGVLLDEAALMPRSFVEQACARCSLPGSKVWLSCNPEGPGHWFFREWVERAAEKRILYLRFTMEDNPGLSRETRERYQRLFRGNFYRRFVLGEWCAADGLVYPFFDGKRMPEAPKDCEEWRISCDYGTVNPASFGLWGYRDGKWFRVTEYYFDSRAEGRQKTDGEYMQDLLRLAGGRQIKEVVVDPSAASFIETLRRGGLQVRKADNRVLTGIRVTADKLKSGELVICRGCSAAEREFGLYRWDSKAGEEKVIKEHDHAMDDIRYFAMSLESPAEAADGWAAEVVERSSRF